MTTKPYACRVCDDPINGDDWERVGERFCSVACRDHWGECRGEDVAFLLGHLPTDIARLMVFEGLLQRFRESLDADVLLSIFPDTADHALHGPVRTRRMEASR